MELLVQRQASDSVCTLGELFTDGIHQCWTLEDVVREIPGVLVSEWKIQNKTAIPQGRYRVIITFSQHFGRNMPELVDVPGFTAVRIHWGNEAADTDGCLLVGETEGRDQILQSRVAFELIFDQIDQTIKSGDEVWIEYRNYKELTDGKA